MSWAVTSVTLDADKSAGPRAGNVTAVYTYADATPPFTYAERLDSSTSGGFGVRAHAAKVAYEALVSRQNTVSTALLTQLQAQDP